MTYHIKPQGDSFLVVQADPEHPKDRLAERIIAVCGNRADATLVVAGLYATTGAKDEPAGGIGQH